MKKIEIATYYEIPENRKRVHQACIDAMMTDSAAAMITSDRFVNNTPPGTEMFIIEDGGALVGVFTSAIDEITHRPKMYASTVLAKPYTVNDSVIALNEVIPEFVSEGYAYGFPYMPGVVVDAPEGYQFLFTVTGVGYAPSEDKVVLEIYKSMEEAEADDSIKHVYESITKTNELFGMSDFTHMVNVAKPIGNICCMDQLTSVSISNIEDPLGDFKVKDIDKIEEFLKLYRMPTEVPLMFRGEDVQFDPSMVGPRTFNVVIRLGAKDDIHVVAYRLDAILETVATDGIMVRVALMPIV